MVLKDTKFMKENGYEDVPGPACAILDKRDVIHRNLVYLDQIARCYNKINRVAKSYEVQLLQNQLTNIDNILLQGEEELKWKDHDGQY